MPCALDYDAANGGRLIVHIGGLDSEDFQHALNIVKSITGRTFNPETKGWEFPADYMTATKIINMLGPVPSPAATAFLGEAKQEQADAVRTKLPDDADVPLSWGDRLYPFQRAAVGFVMNRPHTIVADDMGVGKTIEAIASVYAIANAQGGMGRRLIVCPHALMENWQEEVFKWRNIAREADHLPFTDAQPTIIDGRTPTLRRKQLERGDAWVIVNWEKLRVMPELAKIEWGAILADEAHRAKNRKAKQTQAMWKLHAPIQLALTGTPIMNSPDELYPLLKWLYPKTYTSYWRFYMEYCEFVEVHFGARRGRVVTGVKNVDALRFELSDKLIRRTKREVLPWLPEKLPPQIIHVEMAGKQRKLYDEMVDELWVKVEQEVREGKLDADVLEHPERLLLLSNAAARTTRLRQVASTPALLGAADDSAKLDACVEYIRDMDEDNKAVIFTEFTDTADILVRRLAKLKIDAAAFHGKVDRATRDGLKHAFQNEPDPRVLVCTPETGGVGLTLTRANVAGFIEEDWVPVLNTQAEDRLHRIGQTREVHVIIWRAKDSVDTKRVAPTLVRKDRIVSSVVKQDKEVPDPNPQEVANVNT